MTTYREDQLAEVIRDLQWMARRYAHGRMTYAVAQYNDAVEKAINNGVEFPDLTDGTLWAKDGSLGWPEDKIRTHGGHDVQKCEASNG